MSNLQTLADLVKMLAEAERGKFEGVVIQRVLDTITGEKDGYQTIEDSGGREFVFRFTPTASLMEKAEEL